MGKEQGGCGYIGERFGQLRERTSDWSYRHQGSDETLCDNLARGGMLSDQWTCMGAELPALYRDTRVPNDILDTRRIFQAVRCIPECVVCGGETHKEYPDMCEEH